MKDGLFRITHHQVSGGVRHVPPLAPGLCFSKTAAFESMKDEPNRRPRMRSSSAAVERTSAGWRGDRWAPTPAPAAADCGKSL